MTSDSGLGPAPPKTVALWVRHVRRMDREVLEWFVRRTRATWDPESLGPLLAVQAHRAELAAMRPVCAVRGARLGVDGAASRVAG